MAAKKEKRKRKRFQAPDGVFVGVGPGFVKVGRLRDLSMDGLAFRYLGHGKQSNGSYVDIFITKGNVYLGGLPIRTISDVEVVKQTSSHAKSLRRCSVKFKDLTHEQKAKLRDFIEAHTTGEV